MSQRNRHDAPGRTHHVMNRGAAKRVIFPDHHAKQRFLALMACSCRRGELFVQAFCIMDTHFHVVGGTPEGNIGYPFMRINNAYARYFNRRYRRDGSPFRGRITSSPVLTSRYWRTLIAYNDFNPVNAGICKRPTDYPYGSARLYARSSGPRWLDRSAVESHVREASGAAVYHTEEYLRVFNDVSEDEIDVLTRRLRGKALAIDPLDRLFRMPPPGVASWMRRKARLADGLAPWVPIAGSRAVQKAVEGLRDKRGRWLVRPERNGWDAWSLLETGLLHDAAGMSCQEIGRHLGCAASTAGRRLKLHRVALIHDVTYALEVGRAVRAALKATYQRPPRIETR